MYHVFRPQPRRLPAQTWIPTLASGTTQAITPDTGINATSTVTGAIQRLRPLPVAAINATSNVSGGIQRLRPIPASAINSTSTVAASVQFLRRVTPASLIATSNLTATITGGTGGTQTNQLAPFLQYTHYGA